MTLRKTSILSAAAVIIAVTGMVQAAVTPPMHITIEYEYARDGEIVSRTVNGKVQRYAYDRCGQLTGIYDADGQAVEAYTYGATGNILKKTINGKTTTFTYDAANQLVSKQDEAGTTSYEYDAAGRMIREGDKEYRYSYLDKITSVIENGETAATMDYFVGGQLASVTRGHEIERFIWDGLALVHRDGSDYLNEPAVGGGNPIASGGQVMFNDMLGSTVAVKGDENYSLTSMTAFGESSDTGAFFTGKPFVGEIGYAFLMRSYRPEHGKWQTADPIGYPDGWNNLAYCNNGVTSCVDLWGCLTVIRDDPPPPPVAKVTSDAVLLYADSYCQYLVSYTVTTYDWRVAASTGATGAIDQEYSYTFASTITKEDINAWAETANASITGDANLAAQIPKLGSITLGAAVAVGLEIQSSGSYSIAGTTKESITVNGRMIVPEGQTMTMKIWQLYASVTTVFGFKPSPTTEDPFPDVIFFNSSAFVLPTCRIHTTIKITE